MEGSAILARVVKGPALRTWVARMRSSAEAASDASGSEAGITLELEPGDPVGEYIVLQKLGEGGFGAVYEAAHPIIGKRAAVKVLHAQYSADEAVTSRFVSEARAVNQIRHKNIVDIFSFGDLADGRHYYVMELLEGVPLDAYLERASRLPVDECLSILHPIAKALAAAHEAGIAHRDLKPENIFLEIDDDGCVKPIVLDFGLAKLLVPGAVTVHKTRSGTPMGSPRYMSPEQCRGVPVDHRTDIYSFGCMAYRMLTGVAAFDANTALELMMAHVSRQPAPPSQVSDLDGAFDEPLLKMLEKQPEGRPQSLLEAYESLVAAAAHGNSSVTDRALASPLLRETVIERERTLPRVLELPKPRAALAVTPHETNAGAQRALPWLLGLIVAVVAAGVYLMRQESGHTAAPVAAATQPSVTISEMVSQPLAPPPQPSTLAVPPRVAVTIYSQPSHAEVYLNGERLGTTPEPVQLPRGEAAVSLVLKAPGYEPMTVPVKPAADHSINVSLPSKTPKASKTGVSRDLENPY